MVAPDATVTVAGTAATAEFALESVTTMPPAGAALLSVTLPVELAPLTTEVGFTVKFEAVMPLILRDAVFDPLKDAVIVTDVDGTPELVVVVKFAVVAP